MRTSSIGTVADFLGGLVAAEATFSIGRVRRGDGGLRPSFTFAVALGAADRASTELLHGFLGVGRVRTYPRRHAHHDDVSVFAVRAFADLLGVVLPFLDEHLPPSHKRDQYLRWRTELVDYDAVRRGGTAG